MGLLSRSLAGFLFFCLHKVSFDVKNTYMIRPVLQEKNNRAHKGKVAAIYPVSLWRFSVLRALMEYAHCCSHHLLDLKSMIWIRVFLSITEMQALPFYAITVSFSLRNSLVCLYSCPLFVNLSRFLSYRCCQSDLVVFAPFQ